jgi:BirA family biotin operon repressor/biotin-[acetyl-CoA-carboxylase] ligase
MTMGINRRHLPSDRLALLPLELGLLLWEEVWSRLPASRRLQLSLKWPNDLLIAGAKTAGMLVESQGEFLFAGIGINVASAPPVADGGTPSACLSDNGMPPGDKDDLAWGLYQRAQTAFADPSAFDSDRILLEWQGKVDWNLRHVLRDRPGRPMVLPLSINRHGHLQVRHADGRQEWLVSDYLA